MSSLWLWLRGTYKHGRDILLDTVFPEQVLCLCCKKVIRPLDVAIQPDLPDSSLCLHCREALEKELLVKEQQRTRLLFTDVWSVFGYAGPVRDLILGLKHGTVSAAGKPLIFYAADVVRKEMSLPADTIVTWVTMPADRKRERCIDHGKILAEGLAKELGLSCRQLLIRKKGGHTQQGLNAEERKKNVIGLFSDTDGEIPGSVLLVDDVLTTGSTVEECGKTLRLAGVRDLAAVTIAAASKRSTSTSQPI